MMLISNRLRLIAECLPWGSRVADIGSDHALLPVYLIQSGKSRYAVAGEVNRGPYEAACRQVRTQGLTGMIQVRHGDGLAVLEQGEVDAVVVAGMGGALMAHILQQGANEGKLDGVSRLVLQPNVAEEHVRRWLSGNGWLLQDEHILQEDGKIYEILSAVRETVGNAAEPYRELRLACGIEVGEALLYLLGPHLLAKSAAANGLHADTCTVFLRKWTSELSKLERIVQSLARSGAAASQQKSNELERLIAQIKEVLPCLRTDKP